MLATSRRVQTYDPLSIWEIDMGGRFGRSDIGMVNHHIVMVILNIDMGYGLRVMMWEMSVSIRSSWRLI